MRSHDCNYQMFPVQKQQPKQQEQVQNLQSLIQNANSKSDSKYLSERDTAKIKCHLIYFNNNNVEYIFTEVYNTCLLYTQILLLNKLSTSAKKQSLCITKQVKYKLKKILYFSDFVSFCNFFEKKTIELIPGRCCLFSC